MALLHDSQLGTIGPDGVNGSITPSPGPLGQKLQGTRFPLPSGEIWVLAFD